MVGDIFDNAIMCSKCGKKMKKVFINRNGFNLRAVRCEECKETLFHPVDKQEYEEFMRLKEKEFNVKMRMVGNSYAVSIPREIVDFMKEQERIMNNMVKLSFQEAGRLSLCFNTPEMQEQNNPHARTISAKEIKVVRNGKPIIHARKFYDSAHPERNQTKVFKAKPDEINKSEEDFEEEEH
jgi:DNA-directed RNA polymerase subunit RPC12/RpoP